MVIVLDCETKQSALAGLSAMFHCSASDLETVLRSIDLEGTYNRDGDTIEVAQPEYLYNYVEHKFGKPRSPDRVCWFHCTRSRKGNQFTQGILPLDSALPYVWAMVIDVARGTPAYARLQSMQEHGVSDFHYGLRTMCPTHHGPYGYLVKDCAFDPSRLWSHDYLRLPEIVEDICNAYVKEYGESIGHLYQSALSPCIVKFSSDRGFAQGGLEGALLYAYTSTKGLPLNFDSVYCFDGEGVAVEPCDILSIQNLDR